MSVAEVHDLNKTYPAFALKRASFSIEEGRITGFIGRNGAGKTTTIKSMLNLVHPDSGEIFYFGKPLAENETEIKKLFHRCRQLVPAQKTQGRHRSREALL